MTIRVSFECDPNDDTYEDLMAAIQRARSRNLKVNPPYEMKFPKGTSPTKKVLAKPAAKAPLKKTLTKKPITKTLKRGK